VSGGRCTPDADRLYAESPPESVIEEEDTAPAPQRGEPSWTSAQNNNWRGKRRKKPVVEVVEDESEGATSPRDGPGTRKLRISPSMKKQPAATLSKGKSSYLLGPNLAASFLDRWCPVFNPYNNNPYGGYWDFVLLVALTYVALVTPYTVRAPSLRDAARAYPPSAPKTGTHDWCSDTIRLTLPRHPIQGFTEREYPVPGLTSRNLSAGAHMYAGGPHTGSAGGVVRSDAVRDAGVLGWPHTGSIRADGPGGFRVGAGSHGGHHIHLRHDAALQLCVQGQGRYVTARWVTPRARWVTLRARWVTLRARRVTLRARWVTLLRARWGGMFVPDAHGTVPVRPRLGLRPLRQRLS
jgi:hypothetical protein